MFEKEYLIATTDLSKNPQTKESRRTLLTSMASVATSMLYGHEIPRLNPPE
jgi:hypothetical protein